MNRFLLFSIDDSKVPLIAFDTSTPSISVCIPPTVDMSGVAWDATSPSRGAYQLVATGGGGYLINSGLVHNGLFNGRLVA